MHALIAVSLSWGGGTGTQGGRAIGVEASGRPIVGRGTGTVSGVVLIPYIPGRRGLLKNPPARCFEFSLFLIL